MSDTPPSLPSVAAVPSEVSSTSTSPMLVDEQPPTQSEQDTSLGDLDRSQGGHGVPPKLARTSPPFYNSSRLPPRAYRHDLPPEAITLWPSDVKASFSIFRTPDATPPMLWLDWMDGMMEEYVTDWQRLCEDNEGASLRTDSTRGKMAAMAREQAQHVLYWHERLCEEGPPRGLLPRLRSLCLWDYVDTLFCRFAEGRFASSQVMRMYGYEPMREEELLANYYSEKAIMYKAKTIKGDDGSTCCCCADGVGVWCVVPPFDLVPSKWADDRETMCWRQDDCDRCWEEIYCSNSSKGRRELHCTSIDSQDEKLPPVKVHRVLRSVAIQKALNDAAIEDQPALALAAAVFGAFLGSLRLEHWPSVYFEGSHEALQSAPFQSRIDPQALNLPTDLFLPPTRPFHLMGCPLPDEAKTFWPVDLLSVVSIRADASNADFWSSTLRAVLLREDEICRHWWQELSGKWTDVTSEEALEEMELMARDQATAVMQGLYSLLELSDIIGAHPHPGPYVFLPEHEEYTFDFSTLPDGFHTIETSNAPSPMPVKYTPAQLETTTPAQLTAALQHLQSCVPATASLPEAVASVWAEQVEEGVPLTFFPVFMSPERLEASRKKAKAKKAKQVKKQM